MPYLFVTLLLASLAATAQQPVADSLVIYFSFDQHRLSPESIVALRRFAQRGLGRPDSTRPGFDSIRIIGYADTTGQSVYNTRLSLQRAQAAADLINSQNTNPTAVSLHAIRLIAGGETAKFPGGDSSNRRVVVIRAQLIYQYLIDDGFDPAKLSYKGMGDAKPRNSSPATAEDARANMRVEVLIFHSAPALPGNQ